MASEALKHCGALFACVREPAHHSARVAILLFIFLFKPGWYIHYQEAKKRGRGISWMHHHRAFQVLGL